MKESLSLINLILDGGIATITIVVILLLILGAGMFIYFERNMVLKDAETDDEFIYQIKECVAKRKLKEAKSLCDQKNAPVARLLEKGISRIGKSTDEITKAIEGAGTVEIYRLEKNISLIGTFAGVAPMIGFLGTVIGMIIAFHEMASHDGQAEIGILATGIYTAMTTTVAGLIVGIICSLAYNHLVIKTERLLHIMEESVISFMDTLNNPKY